MILCHRGHTKGFSSYSRFPSILNSCPKNSHASFWYISTLKSFCPTFKKVLHSKNGWYKMKKVCQNCMVVSVNFEHIRVLCEAIFLINLISNKLGVGVEYNLRTLKSTSEHSIFQNEIINMNKYICLILRLFCKT